MPYKSKVLLFLFCSLFAGGSCSKEYIEEACTENRIDCPNLADGECNFTTFQETWPSYRGATFNPLDKNEFIYYKTDNSGTSLVKYNLTSNEETILIQNFTPGFTRSPAWSRTGWISFSSKNWKIWRSREDGSDLKQISFEREDFSPEFNFQGDKIIYSQNMGYSNFELMNYPELNLRRNNRIIDINGNVIDSICEPDENNFCQQWSLSRWGHNDKILYKIQGNNSTGIAYYDYTHGSREELFSEDLKDGNVVNDIQWHPLQTSLFFTTTGTGLFQYHFNTTQITQIKNACRSRAYIDISVSNDGKQILATKQRITFQEDLPCNLIITRLITIMDHDGCNERIINLP